MPTYEYACRDCGEHLEVVQSFKDDPLTTCPACEGQLRKVFSAAGLIFKGSGWHIKDYASPARSGSSNSESTGDSTGETKSDAKGESKSDSGGKAGDASSSSGTSKGSSGTSKGSSGDTKPSSTTSSTSSEKKSA